jgi:hypothetical protein
MHMPTAPTPGPPGFFVEAQAERAQHAGHLAAATARQHRELAADARARHLPHHVAGRERLADLPEQVGHEHRVALVGHPPRERLDARGDARDLVHDQHARTRCRGDRRPA